MSNDKSIRSYRDLDVWQVSVDLAELCDFVLAECDRVGQMLRNFIRSLQSKE